MPVTSRSSAPAVGVELEMVTAHRDHGASLAVSRYFEALHNARAARGLAPSIKEIAGRPVCVSMPDGTLSTIDNGFNNLESCIGPLSGEGALARLDQRIREEIRDVLDAMAAEDGVILNFAQHPDLAITQPVYRAFRAPKPIYDYWVEGRGWQHWVGIDAKAQNGANVDVAPRQAIRALNVMLAFAPIFIALYANSPFEAGRVTGLKETRLTIWSRMFAKAKFAADRGQHLAPETPFASLCAYFDWMFGGETAMQIIPLVKTLDYKGVPDVARIDGDPSFMSFLASGGMPARQLGGEARHFVRPDPLHFEFLQFSHFLDARVRWRFATYPTLEELREGLSGDIEGLFERHAAGCYIEMRAAGANFPDARFVADSPGEAVRSMVISVTALVAGLIRNLDAAEALMHGIGWSALVAARDSAIRLGLSGTIGRDHFRDVAGRLVDVARQGLTPAEHWMLAFPAHVIETGMNGADRALAAYEAAAGSEAERIRAVAAARFAVSPDRWPQALASVPEGADPQGALGAPSIVS